MNSIIIGIVFGLILMLGMFVPYMILPYIRSTQSPEQQQTKPNGQQPNGQQPTEQKPPVVEKVARTKPEATTPATSEQTPQDLKDTTEPEAGTTQTEVAKSEPEQVSTTQPPVVTTTTQPVTTSPTAPVSTQPIPTTPTQTGSTPVIPSVTPGPETGPGAPATPPSPPEEDMVILPTGERIPKSVIVGYEQICNDKRLNASTYLSRNSSALGLPSSQVMLEPGKIAFDPIRKDCVYPIQAYNPATRQWSPKNMRVGVGILQHFR